MNIHRLAGGRAELDVEASTVGRAAAVERDQEVDEVDPRPTGGEQPAQGGTDHVAETQP